MYFGNVQDVLVDCLVRHSGNIPATRSKSARLFSFVAQPRGAVQARGPNFYSRTNLRSQEKARDTPFTLEEIPANVSSYISYKFTYDPASSKSFLEQACSEASKRAHVTRHNTPSADDPTLTVAQVAGRKRTAFMRGPSLVSPTLSRYTVSQQNASKQ